MNDYISTTKQSTTKPCAYFLGYTVPNHIIMAMPEIIYHIILIKNPYCMILNCLWLKPGHGINYEKTIIIDLCFTMDDTSCVCVSNKNIAINISSVLLRNSIDVSHLYVRWVGAFQDVIWTQGAIKSPKSQRFLIAYEKYLAITSKCKED